MYGRWEDGKMERGRKVDTTRAARGAAAAVGGGGSGQEEGAAGAGIPSDGGRGPMPGGPCQAAGMGLGMGPPAADRGPPRSPRQQRLARLPAPLLCRGPTESGTAPAAAILLRSSEL
eukprot:gene14373-biopygen11724